MTDIDPNLPVSNICTMERHLGFMLLPARIAATALGVFGVPGLLLASVACMAIGAIDPTTFIAVPIVLIAVAALATFVPARRAALVDPAVSIRME